MHVWIVIYGDKTDAILKFNFITWAFEGNVIAKTDKHKKIVNFIFFELLSSCDQQE